MKTCPYCGTANQDSASFCGGCGRDIRAVTAGQTAQRQRMFCTSCGAKIVNGGQFCPVCGAQQNAKTPPQAAAQPAGQAAPYWQPPAPAVQESSQESAPRVGLHILERAVFGIISTILLCLTAYILVKALPVSFSRRPFSDGLSLFTGRIGTDLALVGISTVVSVLIASLLGMSDGGGARKGLAYLSAVLMSAAFPVGVILVHVAYVLRLSIRSPLLPIFAMILFLTGFLLRSAVMPRKKPGFAGALGASCAAMGTGNGIGLAVGFSVILETYYSLPGTGYALLSGFMKMDFTMILAGLIGAFVINGVFRIAFDCIAAACGFEFEEERLLPEVLPEQGRGRSVPVIIFAVLAACLLVAAFVLPLLSRFDPNQMDQAARMLAPGVKGHLLGTDSMGRDVFARVCAALRGTIGIGVLSLLIAAVIGGALGTAAGYLKGIGRAVLEGIIYVLGFLPVLVVPLLALTMRYRVGGVVLICALFWGGIAEKLALYISNLREDREHRLSHSFALVLEELVFSFCLILFIGTIWSFAGILLPASSTALGLMIRDTMGYGIDFPWFAYVPAAALFLCMLIFGLLQASLFRPDQRQN